MLKFQIFLARGLGTSAGNCQLTEDKQQFHHLYARIKGLFGSSDLPETPVSYILVNICSTDYYIPPEDVVGLKASNAAPPFQRSSR
jgi:hypothetical protein